MAPEVYRAAKQAKKPNQGQVRRPAAQGKQPAQKTLTLEERRRRERARREAIRRQKEEAARQRRIRKARRQRLFRLSFIGGLILVILYWSVVAALIINRADGSEDALPLLIFEQGERKEKDEFQPEEICIGETKYLPVSFLEDYLAISQFGDHKTRSFLICANGEFATFYLNNEEVIINGEHCAMKAPALMKDGELLLPIDFYAEKMSCFELGKNNATYGADVLTFLKDQPATFSLNTCTPDAPVDYATVPVAPTVPAEPAA